MTLWKEWKTIKKGDYLYAKLPEHPNATSNGYVLEHRVVLENKLGRLLTENEEAHHKDENKHNNSPENIELRMRGEHQSYHNKLRFPNGRSKTLVKCANCEIEFERHTNNLPKYKGSKKAFCSRRCNGLYHKDKTNNLNRKDNKHGINMYRNGCRCDMCRKANAEKQRKYRESKKKQ